jgi:predicted CXXCH cytochrome family protein
LKAPQQTLCTSCHEELGERLATQPVHTPVAQPDGCALCHGAHTTRHRSLLLDPVATSCLSCHNRDAPAFAEYHLGLSAETMDCTSCHDPHASEERGLLHPKTHEPFFKGDCAVCHDQTKEGGS